MTSRIYVVTHPLDGGERLVRATSGPQALRFVSKDYKVKVASQDDLVKLATKGASSVEDATNG